MSDLAEFILARIADDEQAAHECAKIYPAPWDVYDRGHSAKVQSDAPHFRVVVDLDQDQVAVGEVEWLSDPLYHVAHWNPDRVLAECEARRRIIAAYQDAKHHYDEEHDVDGSPKYSDGAVWAYLDKLEVWEQALKLIALSYADHPEYREGWRP